MQIFSRKDAAKFMGVSTQSLDNLCKEGKISCFKIGTRVLYTRDALDVFIKANTIQARGTLTVIATGDKKCS